MTAIEKIVANLQSEFRERVAEFQRLSPSKKYLTMQLAIVSVLIVSIMLTLLQVGGTLRVSSDRFDRIGFLIEVDQAQQFR